MHLSSILRPLLSGTLVASLLGLSVSAIEAQESSLQEGTPIRMRLNRTISSANAKLNENVDFETLDDVSLNGTIIIPKGSTAIGTVTEAASKRRMARGGKLSMNIDYLRLPGGERLPLRGVQEGKGGGHTGAMTGAMLATGVVFFPAAPLFLFIHGKDFTLPKGHEVTVYTNSEYKPGENLNIQIAQVHAPSARQTEATALTNLDVIKLKEAGLSDQLIVQKVKVSQTIFQLDPTDIIGLKKAGISEGVISAMLSTEPAPQPQRSAAKAVAPKPATATPRSETPRWNIGSIKD